MWVVVGIAPLAQACISDEALHRMGSLLRGNVDLTMPLPYYTENLGFVKKLDIPLGEYRFCKAESPFWPCSSRRTLNQTTWM